MLIRMQSKTSKESTFQMALQQMIYDMQHFLDNHYDTIQDFKRKEVSDSFKQGISLLRIINLNRGYSYLRINKKEEINITGSTGIWLS